MPRRLRWPLVSGQAYLTRGCADDSNILKITLDLVLPILSEGAVIAGQFVRDEIASGGGIVH